ncbi:peptide/nickel transport system substrate-binding protein [Lentzea xinjiangensis]|uniref:Peptide/nickel transport system substrate-binding protein n=1 Tax=Lentzea xinjiangensis TaxID=402600 RepID=A0A1H9QVK3_9PSEU|nr:ABC transporter substrate-binding protein [Lentzea xinjiangensis]SER63723.1 peptide/nickel transport system substrate-binding protein [Lentzea xinjiangensis]
MRRTVIVALALALAATGCSSGGATKASGVLTVGMPNGPLTENHNPFLPTSAAGSLGYRYQIYEPLAFVNNTRPAQDPVPWLATKWDWTDNYKKVTFTLRENVKWSDGKPLTAADVAFSYEILKKWPALNNRDSLKVEAATATPDGKVEVTFPSPQFVNRNKVISAMVVPQHIWGTVPDPTTYTNPNPVGTGPYQLKSFTSQTVTIARRAEYWQELPKVPEIQYTSYNDNTAQTTALASGASQWSYVFIPDYQKLYVDKDPAHHKIWFPAGLGIHGLWLNTTIAPFDNAALRSAMSDVIDREAIFVRGEARLFPKLESPTGMPLPAGESFLAPEYRDARFKIDVDGAKQKLTAAGFTFEGDVLKAPGGKPVTIELTNPSGWSDYLTVLDIIKSDLKKIGIEATVRTQTADAWTTDFANGVFQGSLRWTNTGATPYEMYQNIMDAAEIKPVGQTAAVNFGRYNNPEATAALAEYANAADDATRAKNLAVLQKIMVEQVPMIPTSAGPIGAEYSTKHWVGWPSEEDPYGPPQATLPNALQIVMKLKPAGS